MAQTTNVGHMSAWSFARSKGYTGTSEEFAELMASYATVAQQAQASATSAGQSATDASGSAQTAETAKTTAQAAASSAQTYASASEQSAQSAQASAQSAQGYAQSAESAKDTAVNAVDGFAAGAQQALDSVNQAGNNWKSLAQAQKLDAEAWATGKRDGTDVGSSDETYHNNAKYYAESVSADATTASQAAQTATQKAGEAQASASAAAESARTLTIDNTLTQAGQPADAKATGDTVMLVSDWADTVTITTANGVNKKGYIYAKAGQLITIESDAPVNTLRFGVYYADGTSDSNLRLNAKIRIRPQKDIESIGIYSSSATVYTATVKKTDDPIYKTNYYDKTKKISGYIQNGGGIASGYFHSDFIPVAYGDTVYISGYPSTFGSLVYIFVYDEEKNYLARVQTTLQDSGLYARTLSLSMIGAALDASKAGIAYFSFNMTTVGSDNAVCYINEEPYAIIANGQHLPDDEKLFFNNIQKDYIASAGNQPIAGKKIAYNGDSIAESRLAEGNTNNGGSYPKIIADLTGGTYSNNARGGGILASAVPEGTMPHSVINTLSSMPDDADLICFEGGINDYWRQVPLGDYTESDYSGTLDTTTICGALESIFRQAKEKWVGKPIVFVITHKIKSTVYVANSAGYTMMQAHEKMVGICKKYAIPYYDAFEDSGLNAYDNIQNSTFLTSNSSGTADGCHPNAQGYERYYVPQLIALFNSVIPVSTT